MTLPKNGRRSITVDGVEFHYMIALHRSERAVIQQASGRGACLFVFPHAIMKPSHVAEAIRFGLSNGWTPNQPGDDCWIAFDTNLKEEALFEYIANDDFRVVTYSTHGKIPEGMDPSRFPDTRLWYERKIW